MPYTRDNIPAEAIPSPIGVDIRLGEAVHAYEQLRSGAVDGRAVVVPNDHFHA